MLRPVFKTLTIALVMALAMATTASATKVTFSDSQAHAASFAPGAKPQASVKLRTCRSAAYYDNRLIRFRAKMSRFTDTNAAQKLQMRFDVYQKFNEAKKFTRLKADGLGVWTSSSETAQAYQRDLVLTNVETAARYKARVAFRWTGSDGTIEWHRTLTSKPCKQTVGLPKLSIGGVSSVGVPGSTDHIYTVSVKNTGRSEAVSTQASIVNMPANGYSQQLAGSLIDSLGPKQSADVQLRVPACATGDSYQASILPGVGPVRSTVLAEPVAVQLSDCG